MRRIFVDLEMQPIPQQFSAQRKICKQETIEIGAVILDEADNETASFNEYIRPEYAGNISGNIERLTGIRWDMVSGCKTFATVLMDFVAWCGETDYIVYAWSENDLLQIQREILLKNVTEPREMSYMYSHWKDFQKAYGDLFGTERQMSLQDAVMYSNATFSGRPHDGLNDARTTADIFRMTGDPLRFALFKEKVLSYF